MVLKQVLPVSLCCLAAVFFVRRPKLNTDAGSEEPLSLMQTKLQVGHRSQSDSTVKHTVADEVVMLLLTGSRTEEAEALQELELCSTEYQPISMQVRTEMLRLLGVLPPPTPCRPVELLLQSHSKVRSFAALSLHGFSAALLVPIGYAVLGLCAITTMLRAIMYGKPKGVDRLPPSRRIIRRPERDAWNQGLFSWLSISWASEWVARWGSVTTASSQTIKADELDGLGDEEDEPSVGYKRLRLLWDEELRTKGLREANLLSVMVRFVGLWRLLKLGLWTTGYEVAMYLGPPLAVQYTVGYISWLYIHRVQGFEVPQSQLVVPSLMVILTFTGLPLFMALCNTVSSFLSQRMAIQSCGALSSLVVRKAQCLPVSAEAKQDDIDAAKRQSTAKGEDSDDELLQHKTAVDDITELVTDDNRQWKGPESFSLVQVVANDINMSFVNVPLQLIRVIVVAPVALCLLVMLWIKVKWTIVLDIGTALIFMWVVSTVAMSQVGYLFGFLWLSGNRLQFLENIICSIRAVKACGWEGVIGKKVMEMRNHELVALEGFYWRLAGMSFLAGIVPKTLIFISVFVHAFLYPKEAAMNIFATLPLLFTAQSAILNVLQILPQLINARPAITRCQAYLKQCEAPAGRPKSEVVPVWLHLWPKPASPLALGVPPPRMGPKVCLRAKGSFSWRQDGRPCLRDLDIDLPVGKSLAVIGQTGSGKTTLLHALLGELYPIRDAILEIPEKIAYSGQTPYICEGTLRGNVVFSDSINEQHYQTAISAACLLPDLEVLPGGEQVPIGSRGISLSGGQKARVAMARASYSSAPGGLVLIDDPFGAVDSRTAKHLLDNLIHGPGLEGRTRVVSTQPDPERIARFDQVAILEDGRIAVKGTPSEVMETREYQGLLNTHQRESLGTEDSALLLAKAGSSQGGGGGKLPTPAQGAFQLREEEFQGRVDWATVDYFCSTGRWSLLGSSMVLYLLLNICWLMTNVQLQAWSSDNLHKEAGVSTTAKPVTFYMWSFLIWWWISWVGYFFNWAFGIMFTLRMSRLIFKKVIVDLLHAPVDRFFDRTPVGRIMNRLSSDLSSLDNGIFTQVNMLFNLCWLTFVPVAYIHILMPLYFTAFIIPVYYLIFQIIRRYWNTMVPMRYLTHISKSATDDLLTEVAHSNVSVRAMQKADYRLAVFQSLLSNQIKADITTQLVLQRWLVNRLFALLGFAITLMVLVAVWVPGVISFGGVGLCMCTCFQVVTGIEGYMGSAAGAQFQLIVLNRLYEYTKLPQEKPNELPTDGKYKNFGVTIERKALGSLCFREEGGVLKVFRLTAGGAEQEVLVQMAGTDSFQAPHGTTLGVLQPDSQELKETVPWHRVVAVNGHRGDLKLMATTLCKGTGDGTEVRLDVHSGWLEQGAEVVIEGLRTGYGDIPRDILRDVNLIIEPRQKVGIVGTTGCGKSTLLLSLLRILEPRQGKIFLNGVDTQLLGLQTLRSAVGLVPQDPVLMQGSIRDNLDPFEMYSDNEILFGLKMVQLEETVNRMDFGIRTPLAADGGNLSFGQRQLLCLARTVIRQPALILLDEATSALDPHTQELVQTTVQKGFPQSTIVVIAHRLETILNFDLIVVMEQGDIVEKGSVKDLGGVRGGIFAKMLEAKRTW